MNENVKLPCVILEVTRDKAYEIEGKSGKSASLLVRVGGKVVKLKADNNRREFLDEAQKNVDQNVDVLCEVRSGQNLAIQLVAVALE